MGAVEAKLIEEYNREGRPLPDKIQNAPELGFGLEFYYNAFEVLGTCRISTMALGPIPWTAMRQYCDEFEVAGIQREDFYYLLSCMDDEYCKYLSKQKEPSK